MGEGVEVGVGVGRDNEGAVWASVGGLGVWV